MITQVISGGQTGVDRAALDAATDCGLPTGGWCPRGRRAEDGIIPDRYPLRETETPDYATRTRRNVETAGCTLILCRNPELDGGTALTREIAEQLRKPVLVIDLSESPDLQSANDWLNSHGNILNVAGPRESQEPGIHQRAHEFLCRVFRLHLGP